MSTTKLSPAASWMQSPAAEGRCEVCGAKLGHREYRITSYPDGVHDHCSTAGFPHDLFLERLRTLARCLSDASRETIALGQQLRALQERWPQREPADFSRLVDQRERWRRAVDELERHLW